MIRHPPTGCRVMTTPKWVHKIQPIVTAMP